LSISQRGLRSDSLTWSACNTFDPLGVFLFEAIEAEQAALLKVLAQARDIVDKFHPPDGYNIGINHGQAGGVRWGLPDKAKY
jgi:hypothetical protein